MKLWNIVHSAAPAAAIRADAGEAVVTLDREGDIFLGGQTPFAGAFPFHSGVTSLQWSSPSTGPGLAPVRIGVADGVAARACRQRVHGLHVQV
jgi:hypothetical protein